MLNERDALEILSYRPMYSREDEWKKHSLHVGSAAREIAYRCGLDGERAYISGLIHDIGKMKTDGKFRHITEGYIFMNSIGELELARICLTHSFPVQTVYSYVGEIDICREECNLYEKILNSYSYDAYDKLIQFCDSISAVEGYVSQEKKLLKNVLKYGVNEYTAEKWKTLKNIKNEFETVGNFKTEDIFKLI